MAPTPGKTPAVLDGGIYALTQVGDTIVAGGSFTKARSWNGDKTETRTRLLAFKPGTGTLVGSFAPKLNGTVYALVPGPVAHSVLAAGAFKKLNGKSVGRLVLINTLTGTRINSFKAASVNGRISSLAVHGNRLYVGGNFTEVGGVAHAGLASLNFTTGALDPFVGNQVAQRHNDTGSGARGAVGVTELEVTPAGDRVVAIGNFKKVDGRRRDQVVVLNTGGSSSVVSPTWATNAFSSYCHKRSFDSWVRDLSISPDGSYFVVGSSGGASKGALCDSAARFETYASGTKLGPTWVDYTGGDTVWGVQATADAVYVGGHMRWMNNINGRDRAAQGAVPRPGIAALDPENGMPLAWNPGRHPRGEAVYTFLATSAGLYLGSNTDWIGNFTYKRPRLAFFPLAGGRAVAGDYRAGLPGRILIGSPGASGDGLTSQSFDGTTVGAATAVTDTGVPWGKTRGAFWIGGTLFYGRANGWIYSRTYANSTFGPAVKLDPYHDPQWAGVRTGSGNTTYTGANPSLFANLGSVSGMAYYRGRVYYTVAGSPVLRYRYFSADSGTLGSQTFNASNGISWRKAQVAFTSGDYLYFVSRTTGKLRRILLSAGLPTGPSTLVDGSRDWRGRALFLAP